MLRAPQITPINQLLATIYAASGHHLTCYEVAVDIVFAARAKKAQLFTFAIQVDATFGFCVKPKRIKVSPIIL
jgi:hypothetical protein